MICEHGHGKRRVLDKSCLDLEPAEDGETFFLNVVFEDDEEVADKRKTGDTKAVSSLLNLKKNAISGWIGGGPKEAARLALQCQYRGVHPVEGERSQAP